MHSEECRKRQAEFAASQESWKRRYPKYCRDCGGWGGKTFYQSHPYGMGSASEQMFEPCDCTSDLCPRCGGEGLTSEDRGDDSTGEGPCRMCGWNYDDGLSEFECWGDCVQEVDAESR